ncbi:zinc finger protein 569-like isoform X2 [Galleria mellonella]|uniref:Zinc finger protein 569-like isoform X2 n=1 Tax=Galleria mellonella TaxID=7137 RepID=A0ABM3MAS3_GALME|nr:zinc finger protein 569-like isoform X2 [Galleria mellonella]
MAYLTTSVMSVQHYYTNSTSLRKNATLDRKYSEKYCGEGLSITYEAVYKVDRKSINLCSALDIITVSTAQVKTYFINESNNDNQSNLKESNDEQFNIKNNDDQARLKKNISDDENEIEAVDDDCVHDDSYSDHHDPDNDPVDNDIDHNLEIDENINETEDKKIELELEIVNEEKVDVKLPCSPINVFVDDKKDIVQIKSEEIKVKKRKTSTIAITPNKKKYSFKAIDKKTNILEGEHWRKISLDEEEAIKEFRARSEDPKYIAAAFKCTDCFKGFSKQEMLNRHKHLRHNEISHSFECRFCRMRYSMDCYLRKHMRQHYTKYECLRCNRICPLETTALLHEEYHSGVLRKCIHCDEEFRHMSTYYTHLRTHRSEHVCTLCGVSFVSMAGLHQHKKVKHVNNEIESPDDEEEVNTYCERCNIRFETRKAYDEHLFHSVLHIEADCNDSQEDNSTPAPRKVLGKKEQAKIATELRKRKPDQELVITGVATKSRRRKPKRLRTKPTTCHQCGKHFETQAACLKHHLAEHPRTSFCPPTERYICEICGASLAPGSIAVHQNIHTRERVYPCDICGRSFHASVGLKRHLVTHTGEKPFACTLCDKRFTQSNSMKLHYRTFHLKQPYPKRNRRKKKELLPETADAEESKSGEESDSMPEPEIISIHEPGLEPVPNAPNVINRPDENMHYLTLT